MQIHTKASLQRFYILHARAYRETSLILDCFTKEDGRLSLIARGVKKNKSPMKAVLQPGIPLLGSWQGRGDLAVLTHAEAVPGYQSLKASLLFNAFYVNELLTKLMHRHDPHPAIFDYYQALFNSAFCEADLRFFEKHLLAELGYGLNLSEDSLTQAPLDPNQQYHFHATTGCVAQTGEGLHTSNLFQGSHLLAISENHFQTPEVLREAKRLMRLALASLLGDYTIKSRELFR